MARLTYDDFLIQFSLPTGTVEYHLIARSGGDPEVEGRFVPPWNDDDLAQAIRTLGRTRSVSRDIGTKLQPQRTTAKKLGLDLAGALFTGELGKAYEAARRRALTDKKGIRLRLALTDTPDLHNVPWELLRIGPTFLASQERTPIVRYLEHAAPVEPTRIAGKVSILGVIANPDGTPRLDVNEEKNRVERALASVGEDRVEIRWLEQATPRRLRETLRDGTFHILHFIGHSDFQDGQGVLLLETDEHASSPMSADQLASLVASHSTLRLVVLNSCEGARADVTDPFSGLATSVVATGVQAVIAMQFEITDPAASLFAEVLYHSLIARQDPVDAAVAEARKAVFNEVNEIEWATPVLFLRNADSELFTFDHEPTLMPRTPQRPPRPPGFWPLMKQITQRGFGRAAVAGGVVAALALVTLTVFALSGGEDNDAGPTTVPGASSSVTGPSTSAAGASTTAAITYSTVPGTTGNRWVGPRVRSNLVAIAAFESDGETHISHLGLTGQGGETSSAAGVDDAEPAWDPKRNVIVFTRTEQATGTRPVRSNIRYVVPGFGRKPDGATDQGIQVRSITDPPDGSIDHAPAWRSDGSLLFARTRGCQPGPGCVEDIWLATFTRDGDYIASTTLTTPGPNWSEVTRIASSPVDDGVYVVSGRNLEEAGTEVGVWVVENGRRLFFPESDRAAGATFLGDKRVVAVVEASVPGWGPELLVWINAVDPPAGYDAARVLGPLAGSGAIPPAATAQFSWIAPSADGTRFAVLVSDRLGGRLPVIVILDQDLRAVDVQPAIAPSSATWTDIVGLSW